MHVRSIGVGFALIFVLVGCGAGEGESPTQPKAPQTPTPNAPAAGSVNVEAGANSNIFTPQDVKVAVGKAVTWTFRARSHNVVFESRPGVPPNIATTSSAEVSRTFNTAGDFSYECTLHPGMKGSVKVE